MTRDPDDPKLLVGVGDQVHDASFDDEVEPLPALLADAIRDLPDTIEPSRDLFPGILDALDAPEPEAELQWRSSWPLRTAVVSLAAAAALVTIAAGSRLASQESGPPVPVATTPAAAPAPEREAMPKDRHPADAWADDLARGNRALVAQLERRDDLSPEARAAIDANLARIDAAIAEIRALLEERPGDPELQRWLEGSEQLKKQVLVSALRSPEGS